MRTDGRNPVRPTGGGAVVFLVLGVLAVAVVGSRLVRSASSQREAVVASFALDQAPSDSLAALVAYGERVYQGNPGGALCATCHGPQAKGVPALGPDLTDGKWLHGDGSMDFLRAIIRTGVPRPKGTAAVMPPFGGSPLKPDQLEAVAAYVHSLNAAGR